MCVHGMCVCVCVCARVCLAWVCVCVHKYVCARVCEYMWAVASSVCVLCFTWKAFLNAFIARNDDPHILVGVCTHILLNPYTEINEHNFTFRIKHLKAL